MLTDVEHASLRQEILENGGYAISVANFVVSVTGVALFAGFQFRNPYVVLIPLIPLYYGFFVAFNTHQSIARIAAYLRVLNKKYELDLAELRHYLDRMERELGKEDQLILSEEWIAPILQKLFIALGFICIICFGFIVWFIQFIPNTTSNATPDLIIAFPYNVIFGLSIFFWWLLFARRSKRRTYPAYKERSPTKVYEEAWRNALKKHANNPGKLSDNIQEKTRTIQPSLSIASLMLTFLGIIIAYRIYQIENRQ